MIPPQVGTTAVSHLRVPVAVIEDARVGTLEIDAEAPRPRGKQEDELLRPLKDIAEPSPSGRSIKRSR